MEPDWDQIQHEERLYPLLKRYRVWKHFEDPAEDIGVQVEAMCEIDARLVGIELMHDPAFSSDSTLKGYSVELLEQ